MDAMHGYPGGGPQNGRAISREELDKLMAAAKKAEPRPIEDEDWTAPPKPDLAIAKVFWSAFSPDDAALRLRFVMFDKELKKSHTAREVIADSVDAAWPHVVEFQKLGYEAYFIPNLVPSDAGSGWGGMAEDQDVAGVRALFVDFDHDLPEKWHTEPSFIVHSSKGKAQAFWLVAGCDVADFTGYQEQLLTYYADAKPDGAVINPSRIMRLPGSIHQKDRSNPQLVTFERVYGGPARSTWGLTKALPEAAPRAEKKTARIGERREVSVELLMEVLPFIDPACPSNNPKAGPRNIWMGIASGIKNTIFTGQGDDFNEDIFVRWSSGEFWAGEKAGNYEGEDATRHAFHTSKGNASFGSLIHHAKAGGWKGDAPWDGSSIIYPTEWAGKEQAGTDEIKLETPPKAKPRFSLMSVDAVFAMPDPVELVKDLLYAGENTAFVGEPKSGKTFIALDIALSLAAGVPVLDEREVFTSGIVVYLSGEGHAGMKRRIKAWLQQRGLTKDAIKNTFFYNKGVPTTSENAVANTAEAKALIEVARRRGKLVLVVIDTMARSLGGMDENTAAAASQYLDLTEKIRSGLECCILTIAHASNKNKKPGDPVDFRGSSGFSAGFDATWTAQRNEVNGTVKVAPRWLKEADLGDVPALYFQLEQKTLDDFGTKGAALKAVNAAMFDQGTSFPQKGQYSYPGESDAEIIQLLTKLKRTCYAAGLTHRQLAEEICGPRPAGATGTEWDTAVAKCKERLRKRRDKKGLGSEEVPGVNGTELEWRWWYLNTGA